MSDRLLQLESGGCRLKMVTPAASTSDLKDVMVTRGLITDSGASPLDLDGGKMTCGNLHHEGTTLGFYNNTERTEGAAVSKPSLTTLSAPGFANAGVDMVDITSTTNNADAGGIASDQNSNNTNLKTAIDALIDRLDSTSGVGLFV
jgi:hypothetical protein